VRSTAEQVKEFDFIGSVDDEFLIPASASIGPKRLARTRGSNRQPKQVGLCGKLELNVGSAF
jgi:hypothetical protein